MDESNIDKKLLSRRLFNLDPEAYQGLVDYTEMKPENKIPELSMDNDFGRSLLGQPTFQDTGRVGSMGEGIDSMTGHPLREAIKARMQGENLYGTLKAGAKAFGNDPGGSSSDKWVDLVSEAGVKNPYVGSAIATAADLLTPNVPMGTSAGVAGTIAKKELPAILKEIDTAEKAVALKGAAREKYLSALEEAFGSRDKRAQEMGFDLTNILQHSTPSDFDKFDLSKAKPGSRGFGIYTAPKGAENNLAEAWGNPETRKILDLVRNKNSPTVDFDSKLTKAQLSKIKSVMDPDTFKYMKNNGDLEVGSPIGNVFRRIAVEHKSRLSDTGAKTVEDAYKMLPDPSKDIANKMGISGVTVPGHETVIFDPKNVRKTDAAFDPRFADSDLLMAGQLGAGPMSPEAMALARRLEAIEKNNESKKDQAP